MSASLSLAVRQLFASLGSASLRLFAERPSACRLDPSELDRSLCLSFPFSKIRCFVPGLPGGICSSTRETHLFPPEVVVVVKNRVTPKWHGLPWFSWNQGLKLVVQLPGGLTSFVLVRMGMGQTKSSPPGNGPQVLVHVFHLLGFHLGYLLWMDEILHHFETMGSHCSLVFTGESSF